MVIISMNVMLRGFWIRLERSGSVDMVLRRRRIFFQTYGCLILERINPLQSETLGNAEF